MFRKKLAGSVSLRCFAVQHKDHAVAACLDLCLAAQADSMDEARGKLHEQIMEYLEDAADHEFQTRPAPLGYWVQYYWISLRIMAANLGKRVGLSLNGIGSLFSEQVPLKPNHA